MAIGLDNLKPLTLETTQSVVSIQNTLEGISIIADRSQEDDDNPPAYAINEMIERLCAGTNESVTLEYAPFLLKRNIRASKKYPGKFNFARDGRLKYSTFPYYSHDVCMHMAEKITMPYLFVTASDTPEYEKTKYTEEVISVLLQNPNFEYQMIDSDSHHFHLVVPEKISEILSDFIRKHRRDVIHHL